jgi:hypothetical protein
LEQVIEGTPTGKLMGIQIKTGESHFEDKDDRLIYYGKIEHAKYWINHSLPVLIIAHLPNKKKTYWQIVNTATINYTSKAWKIEIPKVNELNIGAKEQLNSYLAQTPEQKKIEKLFFDKELITHLLSGCKINIYTEDWLHKSLQRGVFKIILLDNNGDEIIVKEWFMYYYGTIDEILNYYFPWANTEIDKDYYEENFDESSIYNMFSESYIRKQHLYPYKVMQGEVGAYRINLVLNDLGRSFIKVLEYIENEDPFYHIHSN